MTNYVAQYAISNGLVPKKPLPGSLFESFARRLGERLFVRVFGQVLADMREEHQELLNEGDERGANAVLWRGRIALLRAAAFTVYDWATGERLAK